jgi:hypothetical protein
LADAGLTEKLERLLKSYALESGAIRVLRETIDREGIRSAATIQQIGNMTRAGMIKPRLFTRLAELQAKLEAASPIRRNPVSTPVRADLKEKRGPGDPVLLRLGTDYPVPVEKLYPRAHTQSRRIFEYLLGHRVTRLKLIDAGRTKGWSPASAKLMWARLQSPQIVRAGWLLDIDEKKEGQLIQLPPTWDFRKKRRVTA